MSENTYSIEYSKSARAKCKYSRCGKSIEKDAIRIVKSSPSAFGDRPKTENYHAECIFKSFLNARKATRKIESPSDIEGLDSLKASEQSSIKKLIKEYTSGELKDKVPKQTRKRKADDSGDEDTNKKKKTRSKNSDDDEAEVKQKGHKRKSEDDSNSEEYKPRKSSKKTRKNLSESEEDSGTAKKKNRSSKKFEDSESEDDRRKKSNPKIYVPPLSDSDDEASEKTVKKKKQVSDEIEESDSSEKENTSKKFLSGKVIAASGKLSMPRKDLAKLIEENGGTYATCITKAVTHVICADENGLTKKLEKARDEGKKIVGENFLRVKN